MDFRLAEQPLDMVDALEEKDGEWCVQYFRAEQSVQGEGDSPRGYAASVRNICL